jgi:desulfoferrodoxin (superoxide reductase-like protein)
VNNFGITSMMKIGIENSDEKQERKVGKIEVKRNGDKVEFVTQCGVNIIMEYMEVSRMIKEFQEKLLLEKLTDEEFKRFKDVVDSEWMRRKFNGNSN